MPRVDVRQAHRRAPKVLTGGRVDEGLEIQPVAKLVQHDGHEIVQRTVVVVEAEIEVEVAAEARANVWKVGRAAEQWRDVHAGSLVDECGAIPGIRKFNARIEPRAESNRVRDSIEREYRCRARTAEHVWRERIE